MQVYKISEDGELISIPLKSVELRSDEVFVFVEDNKKNIFIWKGMEASVRKKFISARSAWKLRGELGPLYKVISIDEGEEPEVFREIIESLKIPLKAAPPAPKEKVEKPKVPPPKPTPPPKPVKKPVVSKPPKIEKPKVPAPPPPPPKPTLPPEPVKVEKIPEVKPTVPVIEKVEFKEILDMLEKLDTPPEYARELLIIGTRVYAMAEVRTKLFGREKVKLSIELLDSLPEGPYLAEGYIPRVIIKDDQVLAIELLKKTRATIEEIKKEIKKGLESYSSLIKKLEKEE